MHCFRFRGTVTLTDSPCRHNRTNRWAHVFRLGDSAGSHTSLRLASLTKPVFTATAGQEVKLRLLNPSGVGRGSIMTLHGHVWDRSPYVCPGENYLGIPGKCGPTGFYPTVPGRSVGSRATAKSARKPDSIRASAPALPSGSIWYC